MGNDMNIDEATVKKMMKRFELLRNIVKQSKNPEMKVELTRIEDMIKKQIPETLKKNAPANFPELYADFVFEYEMFKDFILYDKLIGKNIVALGGGFSSGKSSFLNALMLNNVLPADIDPSTSVPTYIVKGENHDLQGINVFDTKIALELPELKRIAHGFGKIEDSEQETVTEVVTLGHILSSIFLSTPFHSYDNIAFLDTPGYSKPDTAAYSQKTDENIARRQLNGSDFILWFIQADAGTVTEEDIKFIKTLREDIPKLIILSKADKKPEKDLGEIIEKIKSVLTLKGVRFIDVLAFSNKEPERFDSSQIKAQLAVWDKQIYESNFARNFKVLFIKCKAFYEDEIEEEGRRLNRLNKARTLTEDGTVIECLDSLIKEIQKNIAELKAISKVLKELQMAFFTEIKGIADVVGIMMPEPSEIDLMQDKVQNPLQVIAQYQQKKGYKSSKGELLALLQEALEDVDPVFNKQPGGRAYQEELLAVLKENRLVDRKAIHFNDVCHTDKLYKDLLMSEIGGDAALTHPSEQHPQYRKYQVKGRCRNEKFR